MAVCVLRSKKKGEERKRKGFKIFQERVQYFELWFCQGSLGQTKKCDDNSMESNGVCVQKQKGEENRKILDFN